MYYGGVGVAKDREKAKELFRLAADTDASARGLLEMIKTEEEKELEQTQGPGGGDSKP